MNWSRAKVSTIIKSLAAAPNASWVIARSTSGKCYPKPQAFPLERASPRVVVPRSPRLSSRPAEVTKQAAVSGSQRVTTQAALRRPRRLSSRVEVMKQAALRKPRRFSSRPAEVTKRAAVRRSRRLSSRALPLCARRAVLWLSEQAARVRP